MQLMLQHGYGMRPIVLDLLRMWGHGTVILSPRDLDSDELVAFSGEIRQLRGATLIDPQCYYRSSDHERLLKHAHWRIFRKDASGMYGPAAGALIRAVYELNQRAGTAWTILPGLFATRITDDWLHLHRNLVQHAHAVPNRHATLALSSDVLRDERQVETILEHSEKWGVHGYYVVAQTPASAYLTTDAAWLTGLLNLLAGLHLQRRRVVLGYANHQQLIAAAARTDAIASGTWLNVRRFSTDRFMKRGVRGVLGKQRATWYYCPQALSEYRVSELDRADAANLLGQLRPVQGYPDRFVGKLFSGRRPTSVTWPETTSFAHYLDTLRSQAAWLGATSYAEAVSKQEQLITRAAQLTRVLAGHHVNGQDREFTPMHEMNHRYALAMLRQARGGRLKREW